MQTAVYAGFGSRLLAAIIDFIIMVVAGFVLSLVLVAVMGTGLSKQIMSQGLVLVIGIFYYVVYQNKMGQTLGKKVMSIRIVDANGATPGMGTLALREILGKFVSGATLSIGYLWMLWDPRKQTLHDKIASTFVVKV